MKKTKALCLFLCTSVLLGCLCLPARAQTDLSVTGGCHTIDAAKTLAKSEKLLETSKAVILYELKSGTLIYSYNCDNKIYPASMVKLMTALIAVEMGQLTDTVTVTKRALSNVAMGSVSAKLVAGEQLSLESLLYCVMAASANDAAVVVAEYIAGSQEGFIQLMNEKAAQLGCTGTHFSNAHGLHDDETYTTARDLCRILEYALKNEDFRKLFTAAKHTVPATNKSEERQILTSNYMMREGNKKYYDPRVTGGKTGATDEAGRCVAVTAEGGGMELLGIVMGAVPTYEPNNPNALATHGSFEEMKVLLDYAFGSYEYRQVFLENQIFSQHAVANGSNDVVTTPKAALSTVLPIDVPIEELSWVYGSMTESLAAPIQKGQTITDLQLWYNGLCLAQTDLVAANAVAVYTPYADLSGQGPLGENEGSWTLLLIILGVILGVCALLFVLWVVLRKKAADQRMRRRREHKRRKQ